MLVLILHNLSKFQLQNQVNVHLSGFTDALQYVSKRLLHNFCPINYTAIDRMLVTIISVRNQINKRVRPQRAPGRADSAFDLNDLEGDDHFRLVLVSNCRFRIFN